MTMPLGASGVTSFATSVPEQVSRVLAYKKSTEKKEKRRGEEERREDRRKKVREKYRDRAGDSFP